MKPPAVPIIEDDTYGDLVFAPRRARTVKSFDSSNVICLGSLGNLLAPDYRIGWVSGGTRRQDIAFAHGARMMAAPMTSQLAAASFLGGSGFTRHRRRLRVRHADNMALCQSIIASTFPTGTRTSRPQGGHLLWVELPERGDALRLAETAVEHGMSIAPGLLFSSRTLYRRYFRLNTAVAVDRRGRVALKTLGRLACECLQ